MPLTGQNSMPQAVEGVGPSLCHFSLIPRRSKKKSERSDIFKHLGTRLMPHIRWKACHKW